MSAQTKFDWIIARLNEGRTVFLATHLRVTKLQKKHIPVIRVNHNALEIKCGKHWIDYSYTTISAA